jgi:hypothetical protein
MKIVAVVCNVVLFAVTCSIVVTEGIPRKAPYLILTLLPLFVPILNMVVLPRGGMTREGVRTLDDGSPGGSFVNRVAVCCNLVLVALSCWAAITQYPYREGLGVIPFALLMVFTPIVSVVVLLRGGSGKGQQQQGTIAHQP